MLNGHGSYSPGEKGKAAADIVIYIRQLEAEIAQLRAAAEVAGAPVAWSLAWPSEKSSVTVNHMTTFSSQAAAKEYADGCLQGREIEVVPLYRRAPQPAIPDGMLRIDISVKDRTIHKLVTLQEIESTTRETAWTAAHLWQELNLLAAQPSKRHECCCGETDDAWRLCPQHGPESGQPSNQEKRHEPQA
jgi:hypothetical protein